MLPAAQILSLHNCAKISASGLAALGRACPQLRMLLLGGCTLAPCLPPAPAAARPPAGPEDPPMPAATGPLRVIGVVEQGQYIAGGAQSGLQMLREAVEGGGAGWAGGAASAGSVALLWGLVCALPRLRVLELTHFSAAVVDGVRALLSPSGEAYPRCICYFARNFRGTEVREPLLFGVHVTILVILRQVNRNEGNIFENMPVFLMQLHRRWRCGNCAGLSQSRQRSAS